MLLASRVLPKFLLLCLLSLSGAAVAESFVIEDIRVEGLQRISAGTVFNYMPVAVGQRIESEQTSDVIRSLYKTGFFKDVRLEREGNVLVVYVTERPAIAKIDISGNTSLGTEELLAALKDIGLAEGRVFDRSVLDKIERELQRQYFSQGKYAVKLTSTVTPLERNRVAIAIDISEGRAAKIKRINIIGNQAFEEKELLEQFSLGTSGWLSFYTKNDQYSKQKLSGDLETLRSYYLDRGHINFKIDSTQVTITPDKKDIYITVNVSEGEVYTISDIKLAGDLVLPAEDMFPLIHLSRQQIFSRKTVVQSAERVNQLLANHGYAFANVNSIPEIDEKDHQVAITFFVDPGKRVYVRRINLSGNTRTRDQVLRREMRQMESAWFSAEQIEKSRARLERLGFFETVSIETPAVADSTDQVDVNITVEEKPAGNLMAGIGYSQSQGLIFQTNITQNNFMGTGKQVSLGFNNSDANTLYELSYLNPYYTLDGISRGFNLKYRKTEFDELSSARYTTDTGIAGVNFGIPINEFDRINLGMALESTDFKVGDEASTEINDFADREGNDFLDFKATLGWSHDSRDKAIFPTKGGLQSLQAEATVPGSDLNYFKVRYTHQRYFPLSDTFTLAFKGDVGYGTSYADTERLPFFENYFAGGHKSVRGYEDNTLGARDSRGEPLGGNLKMAGTAELVFPAPIKAASKTLRMGAFVDAGNVYDLDGAYDFEVSEIRYSAGVGVTWLSPVGVLSFSVAQPFNDNSDDDIERFQFNFGAAY